MTREPLHYWRRRAPYTLKDYVERARANRYDRMLRRYWGAPIGEPMYENSPLFDSCLAETWSK